MVNEKNYLNQKMIPFIFGSFINGLGLVRSFGFEGINSIVVDFIESVATKSKYAEWVKCPNPNNEDIFIEFLISIGKKLPKKGFILVTNDIWLLPISKNKNKLEKYFILPMSNWNIIEQALNKTYLYDFASKNNILHPKTKVIVDINNIYDDLKLLRYPIILKPSLTTDFIRNIEEQRNTLLYGIEDIDKWLSCMSKYNLKNINIIAQEYIPGNIENLYTITSYTDKKGDLIAFSIGHKIRQNPPQAGTITSGKVVYNKLLHDTAIAFFEKFHFHGIANTEFKYDERDNTFKLIEINARPGMWNFSAFSTGINLPLISYNDYLENKKYKEILYTKNELFWIYSLGDLLSCFKSNKSSNRLLIIFIWVKSIFCKNKVYAIFNYKDIKPFIFDLIININKILKKVEKG